jgi:hypothetical protein
MSTEVTEQTIINYVIRHAFPESEYHAALQYPPLPPSKIAKFSKYLWDNYTKHQRYHSADAIEKQTKYKEYKEYYTCAYGVDFDEETQSINDIIHHCLFHDATDYNLYSGDNELPFHYCHWEDYVPQHYLIRCGDGENLKNSIQHGIWGVNKSSHNGSLMFTNCAVKTDILWFIKSGSNGHAIAFAEYVSHNARTKTNQELGWFGPDTWEIEINYTKLRMTEPLPLYTEIKGGSATIRKFSANCKIDLPKIYANSSGLSINNV